MVNLRLPAISAITVALAILLAILLPHLLGFYYLQIVDLTLVSAVLALGLNFILGFGGQISLAQAAFFGIGAYGFAILQSVGIPAALAAVAAIAITALVGLLLGWPTLRLRGHYLALATLAFAVIVETLLVNADVLTGGADGLSGIPGIGLAGNNAAMLRVLLAVTVVGFLASVAFAKSPLGLRARAFRDDAVAAQALGINISMLKVSLFVVSATYAGVAGVAYDCLRGYISPDVFTWQTTFNYLAMVVVGGLGSSVGAILGALLYTLVPEWLRFLEQGYFVIFGLLVILVITFFPAGLVGLLLRATRLAGAGRRTPPRPIAVKAEGHLP
jgi:branched-chain amino acid transport system permease protein